MKNLCPFLLLLIVAVLAGCGPSEEAAAPAAADPLLGVWKRQSYPYGTIEVKADSVKFAVGEGLPEAPQFMAFRRSDDCPYASDTPNAAGAREYLVLPSTENCEAFALSGDTLIMYYPPGEEGVDYVRQ
ncbi:MAG: hypothetical protein WA952_14065 [Lewinella sp.]